MMENNPASMTENFGLTVSVAVTVHMNPLGKEGGGGGEG